jgi:hypothetical protein
VSGTALVLDIESSQRPYEAHPISYFHYSRLMAERELEPDPSEAERTSKVMMKPRRTDNSFQ